MSQDEQEEREKFFQEFYRHEEQKEVIANFLQQFDSIGYSIINKTKSFKEDFNIDIFQSSIELSIDDLKQILRLIKKIQLNSEFGKLAHSLKLPRRLKGET